MKPLGHKSYGSIPHLPNSRLGPGDHYIHEGQAKILTEKARDRHDFIIVTEKLDGSNVSVARIDGKLVPLTRAGWVATSSKYEQHHLFAHWVRENERDFADLGEGHRICGEWLAQAHGTRYDLTHLKPFVAFDLMRGQERLPYRRLVDFSATVAIAPILHCGPPISVPAALGLLGKFGRYAAQDPAEGVVYRCECRGQFDFAAKFVKHDKVDGRYFPQHNDGQEVWNWRPSKAAA